jgi:hypothetical protein
LIAKAKELDEIRGSSTWKKVLETDDYTGRIESIVNDIKQATENLCVSSPYFNVMSRVVTAEAGSPPDRLATGD